jgi:hypothetical protein
MLLNNCSLSFSTCVTLLLLLRASGFADLFSWMAGGEVLTAGHPLSLLITVCEPH